MKEVKATEASANKSKPQKNLAGQGERGLLGSIWSGEEVYLPGGRMSEAWLSSCKESRLSTKCLMEEIASLSNLSRACAHVQSRKGRGGVDGMRLAELGPWFAQNYSKLQRSLLENSYQPHAVLGVEIPKASGGYRQLGIPTLRDRLVQQAIYQVLSPRYEEVFSSSSYGFRRGRNAHGALDQTSEHISSGKHYVVDMDLSKFFDEVNHEYLLVQLSYRIGDKRVVRLISKFLRSGLMEGGLTSQRIKGTPQGGPLSPLLSNIVLDRLDKELEYRGHSFVRYADDFLILVGSQRAAERVYRSIKHFLEKSLQLKVNEEKSRICRPHELNFLGHGLDRQGRPFLSYESEKRVRRTIRYLTRRNRGVSLSQVIRELNSKLRGWISYFRKARMKGRLRGLVKWLHRRLRCYRLKQCKRALGMARFLWRCGVPRERAWTTAGSRKGWWRRSQSPAACEGMSNRWLLEQGLLDFQRLYLDWHK